MDGLTCCRKIRELERSGELPGHLPLIGMVANSVQQHVTKLMEAGCDDVLAKPLRVQHIISRIKYHVRPLEVKRSTEMCTKCRSVVIEH